MKEKISQFLLVGSICLCILKVHRIAEEDQALILRRKTRVQYNNWAQEHFLLILAFTQPCRADVNSFSTAAKQKLDHQMEEQLAEDEVGPRRDRQCFSDEQRLCFFRSKNPRS